MPCPRDLLFPSTLIVRILLAGTALAASLAALPAPAAAAPLRIATWNLGWHVAEAELGRWTAQCAKTYAKDEASGSWRLVAAGTPGARAGWEVDEGRAVLEGVDLSVMPPCNVYRAGRVNVPVTVPAWRKRNEQIAQVLRESVRADVIAFQEVSGEAAVREALGDAADDYRVCSFDGRYKVQRLAFAWRRSLGASDGPCEVIDALSLPQLAPRDQVRPGLVLTLRVDGRRLRFLTVHLKSGCVSPLDRGPLDAPGAAGEPCPVLQQQVAPLEAALEGLARGADELVLLGDFNRNLAHEANAVAGAEPVRGDGSRDLAAPRPPGVPTRNLLREVNDGQPPASALQLLAAECPGAPAVAAACSAARTRLLSPDERRLLAEQDGLGCRNPIGLDFILVSPRLAAAVRSTQKVALGPYGRTRAAQPPEHPQPLLAVSDHCPLVAELGD
ncbi:endonuclease/exonuclease/phosphatase family protein [Piscinibacter sakaiensis]|uniref:Endonuclease/exonuclease/phosphatase domain-containing protein n=1 Tax=Piscinibacter sakaiensis TaxID=1547922 RepID=A0A0K8P1M2_PISS1|nr:endonuclease/exonuclease/phosphatase family protein [Piscinibacter sakaiensis]GAP36531.1 hypothetical protein ISF6_2371 [Piscinibacter sakaiensis]